MTAHITTAVSATRLIVGIDGLSASWQALAWATEELAAQPAVGRPHHMLLCRSYPPDTAGARLSNPPDLAWLGLADPGLTRRLQEVRQRLATDDIAVRVHLGDLAEHLVALAGDDSITVIAATRPDIDTAIRVAAHAAGVVVAVRPTTPGVDVTGGPFAGHVVVGVDGSASSQAAVRFAFAYADRHHRPVAAVHAGSGEPSGAWIDTDLPETHLIPHAFDFDMLEGALSDAQRDHPGVHVRSFVLRDRADHALVGASAGAVLLVVGDRGRGAVARRMLGSVSRDMIRGAHCTVAVVHESGVES